MPSKKKAAVPVTGEGFVIRVLRTPRRLGIKYAREASEIIKAAGATTTVIPDSLTMFITMPKADTLDVINEGLRPLGLGFVKSPKVSAAYEWAFFSRK